MEAGLADKESLIAGGSIVFEVLIVECLSAMEEAELENEVFGVEMEILFDEGFWVSSPEAFLGGKAQLL